MSDAVDPVTEVQICMQETEPFAAGANVLVAGSAIFSGRSVEAYSKTIEALRGPRASR